MTYGTAGSECLTYRISFVYFDCVQMYRRHMELDATVTSLARGATAGVATSRTALRLSVIPLLPYLLAPVLRSVNIQVVSLQGAHGAGRHSDVARA